MNLLSNLIWLVACILGTAEAANTAKITSYSDLVTNEGTITMGLYGDAAPLTTQNYLQYVKYNLYPGTIIHRLDPSFVFQGGGYNIYGQPIQTFAPIIDEAATSKLSNLQGTVAMARNKDPNSATSQFFFNLTDNSAGLDYGSTKNPDGSAADGYAVFATVVAGNSVVNEIGLLTPYGQKGGPPIIPTGQLVQIAGAFAYSLDEATIPKFRVITNGTGTGTVKSSPGGVCKISPCTYKVKSGQKVNLTATPATGSYFVGWSGDCLSGDRTTSVISSKETPSSTSCVATFDAK